MPMSLDDANASGLLFLMHGPPHARLRQVLARAMSARRVTALRPAVEELARATVERFADQGPPAELLRGVAGPLAAGTLSELLGIELGQRPGFEDMLADAQAMFGAGDPGAVGAAGEQLQAFLAELVAERRARPGTDLVSELTTGRLLPAEVHGLLFALLGAGLVPPAQALLLATARLLDDPANADRLRREPALVPQAVEELLRLDPAGAGSTDRAVRATADVELDGLRVPAGAVVVLPLGAANRDPAEFPDPDALRLDRPTNRHVSFAPGVHHCLGAALARLQLEVGLRVLLQRLPRLTAVGAPDWQRGLFGVQSLRTLHVDW
jgi:cytochrome P450